MDWTPSIGINGTYNVTFNIIDSKGLSDTEIVPIEIMTKATFFMSEDLRQVNKPNLSPYNLTHMQVLGRTPDYWALGADLDNDFPDETRVRSLASNAVAKQDELFYIDIEHLPSSSLVASDQAEWPQTLAKFTAIVDWVKDERPDMRVGYYAELPETCVSSD